MVDTGAMCKPKFSRILPGLAVISALGPFAVPTLSAEPPRLVLQITVDQLRGDLINRYLERMGDGGFRYLLEQGVVYSNAHHPHANTETIVGHTTLATGAYPSAHGMIGNVWFDRQADRLIYNIEDARYRLLTPGSGVDQNTEIDPTQRLARSDGRSPAAILTSTFSDELAIQTAYRAKVFGVSVKDRGTVSMAGHTGKAFWFSKQSAGFVTSNFYYDSYPAWVNEWNASKPAARFGDESWELLHAQDTYLFADSDDQPWETALPGFGRIFPHPYGSADGRGFATFLTLSPAGDELTLDFAKTLIEHEQLGQDQVTDYLSVSFSSTDYVGHLFGPSSLESEDNLLRLDQTLADLLSFVEASVGLDQTLIVFSADHGGADAPPSLNRNGFEVQYVDVDGWDEEAGIAALKERFGVGGQLIREYFHPYVYLNRELIEKEGLNQAEVEKAVAAEMSKFKGVAVAISSTALSTGAVAITPLTESILHNHHPKRSGDIFVVFEPQWFVNDFDGLTVTAHHGSPWSYDTFVPLVFAGAGLHAQRIHRRVETIDVAPTLAAFLGMKPPSGSRGAVLVEVFGDR